MSRTLFLKFPLFCRYQTERITNGFHINIATNEIGYTFRPSNTGQWYWSLPREFTGHKTLSYGGRLEFTQRYTQRPQASYVPDQDIIIIGNGVTIYWSSQEKQQPDIANVCRLINLALHFLMILSISLQKASVVLSPSANWQRLDYRQGPRPASREDILIVLSNIESILIRAQPSTDTVSAYLSDITLDTAVEVPTGQPQAGGVEVCRCPSVSDTKKHQKLRL